MHDGALPLRCPCVKRDLPGPRVYPHPLLKRGVLSPLVPLGLLLGPEGTGSLLAVAASKTYLVADLTIPGTSPVDHQCNRPSPINQTLLVPIFAQ